MCNQETAACGGACVLLHSLPTRYVRAGPACMQAQQHAQHTPVCDGTPLEMPPSPGMPAPTFRHVPPFSHRARLPLLLPLLPQVFVHALRKVDMRAMIGQTSQASVVVRGAASRRVASYSSHPDELQVCSCRPWPLPWGRGRVSVQAVVAPVGRILACWCAALPRGPLLLLPLHTPCPHQQAHGLRAGLAENPRLHRAPPSSDRLLLKP